MLAVVIIVKAVITETAVSLIFSVMAVMPVFTETAVSPVFSMISVMSVFSVEIAMPWCLSILVPWCLSILRSTSTMASFSLKTLTYHHYH